MLLDVSTASRTCHILTGIQRVKTLETLEAERGEGGRGTCEWIVRPLTIFRAEWRGGLFHPPTLLIVDIYPPKQRASSSSPPSSYRSVNNFDSLHVNRGTDRIDFTLVSLCVFFSLSPSLSVHPLTHYWIKSSSISRGNLGRGGIVFIFIPFFFFFFFLFGRGSTKFWLISVWRVIGIEYRR